MKDRLNSLHESCLPVPAAAVVAAELALARAQALEPARAWALALDQALVVVPVRTVGQHFFALRDVARSLVAVVAVELDEVRRLGRRLARAEAALDAF